MSRDPSPIEQVSAGVRLRLLVQPRASISEVTGLHDGRIRIRLAAPPVEGEANRALLQFLAKLLKVPLTALTLTKGSGGRRKEVMVSGIPLEKAWEVLLPNR